MVIFKRLLQKKRLVHITYEEVEFEDLLYDKMQERRLTG